MFLIRFLRLEIFGVYGLGIVFLAISFQLKFIASRIHFSI